jgi:hypothetical protein
MDLTGVLIHGADLQGNVKGPIWHTSMGRGGRLLGVTRFAPPVLRAIPFGNDPISGEFDKLLGGGSHMTTLFWQFLPGEFPPAMVLNLYFNGGNFSPQISVVVPFVYGLTQFYANPSPSTLALDASEVDNQAGTWFDDGIVQARLGAAFYTPSAGDTPQWRPADFVDLDRVGTDYLLPDGRPDGIMVFELVVAPSPPRPAARFGGVGSTRPGGITGPLGARVGPDESATPRQAPPLAEEEEGAATPEPTVAPDRTVTAGSSAVGTAPGALTPKPDASPHSRPTAAPGTAAPATVAALARTPTAAPGRTARPTPRPTARHWWPW